MLIQCACTTGECRAFLYIAKARLLNTVVDETLSGSDNLINVDFSVVSPFLFSQLGLDLS